MDIVAELSTTSTGEPHALASLLSNLLETCHDGLRGYQRAVRETDDAAVREALTRLHGERAESVIELRDLIFEIGGVPAPGHGTIGGALHARWMDAKAAVTGGSVRALVAECDRGEERAQHEYETALRAPLPARVRERLLEQMGRVVHAREELARIGATST